MLKQIPQIPQIPRGIADSNAAALVGTYSALLRGSVDFWSGAAMRGATPFDIWSDVSLWAGTALRRDRPQWASDHRIVKEWPAARLRDFSKEGAAQDTVATVFLPPQAGHDSCIVDYSPGQSQVMTARGAGLDRVFSLDWRGATQETKHTSIEDYIEIIHEVSQLVGGRINLIGDCQGGWLATIYAALHPETVNTLTIAGAPIDYHAGEPLLHAWVQMMTPGDDVSFYRRVVERHNGVLPGDFLLTGFMSLQPHNELERQMQLLANINDEAYVKRYRGFETWFQWTQPLPGAFYLWVVEHLFKNNELVRGRLMVGGELVQLGKIKCPLFLLAGDSDHITPAPQVWALEGKTSTPPEQVTRRLVPGGHLGLFMGRSALVEDWTPTFAQIKELSAKL